MSPTAATATPGVRIPRATYRLQLHREFTFAQARAIVPYLAALGVSHLYASPFLRARPGSTHGYDVVDHAEVNPEIGTDADFDALVVALREHGMGLMLDLVPNHMGVLKADNRRWLDVLEHGSASQYADFFDIDWTPPPHAELGQVLVPILGEHYGTVLERGEIALRFAPEGGELSLWYFEHRLPIRPAEYPRLLLANVADLETTAGTAAADVLRAIADDFAAALQCLGLGGGDLPVKGADAFVRIDRPEIEILVVPGGNFPTMRHVAGWERRFGKPVITTNQAALWAMLRVMGVSAPLPGLGRLLEQGLG